jgi:hypothetical protein
MPLIIDSAPDCIAKVDGAKPADDTADFIVNAPFEPCREAGGGIMTFGPGSTYGDEGASAADAYYILTYLGIIVTLAVIVAWVVYENRRLLSHAARLSLSRVVPGGSGPGADVVPPQPGTTPKEA